MKRHTRESYALLGLVAVLVVGHLARPDAEQIFTNDSLGQVVRLPGTVAINPATIGRLVAAMDLPFGFEEVDSIPSRFVSLEEANPFHGNARPISINGMRLRAALDALTTADPRYSWREMDGVILIRPKGAWTAIEHPLDARAPRVELNQVSRVEASYALGLALGARPRPRPPDSTSPPRDATRFSLSFTDGTVMDLLNRLVVAHGGLYWTVLGVSHALESRDDGRMMEAVLFLHTFDGPGTGVRALKDWTVTSESVIQLQGQIPAAAGGARVRSSGAAGVRMPPTDPLDKQVALSYVEPWAIDTRTVKALALDSRLSFGFEDAGAFESRTVRIFNNGRPPPPPPLGPSVQIIRGMTLREVLDNLVMADPRYEWRSMDGVIVIRPVAAWYAGTHPLHRPASPVERRDIRLGDGLVAIRSALGWPKTTETAVFADRTRFSLTFFQGSVLDLMNAVARDHGDLVWTIESAEEGEFVSFDGNERVTRSKPGLTIFAAGETSSWLLLPPASR